MVTVVTVGNTATRTVAGRVVTPRGYRWQARAERRASRPADKPRTVHPIEAESFRILRSRLDTSRLPPLRRAVIERVVHSSADLGYAADLIADEANSSLLTPRCTPARRSSPTWRWSPPGSPPAGPCAGSARRGAARG